MADYEILPPRRRGEFLDSVREEYPEMAAKAATGDRDALSWIKGADELLELAERSRRVRSWDREAMLRGMDQICDDA